MMSSIDTNQLDWMGMKVNGIFSKDLLSHENGTFKMVRLEPQAKYPIHQHPDKTEFAYVLEGVLEATIGENVYTGEPGAFLTFPVGAKHGLHNPTDKETVVLIGAVKDSLDSSDDK